MKSILRLIVLSIIIGVNINEVHSSCDKDRIPERFYKFLKSESQTLICSVGEWDVVIFRNNENYNASIIRGWNEIESFEIDFNLIDSIYENGAMDSKAVIKWGFEEMPGELPSEIDESGQDFKNGKYYLFYYSPEINRPVFLDGYDVLDGNKDLERKIRNLREVITTVWIYSDTIQNTIKRP